ncbi:MAG TPA: hypothetical protein PKD00_03130 [Burkholderiales bacterium]|nr:hypothetical protein [Burkholderiales bacterium]
MLVVQIAIIVLLFLSLIIITLKFYNNNSNNDTLMLFYSVILASLLFITISLVIELDKLRKNLKCPEYEKVENVYKLKH